MNRKGHSRIKETKSGMVSLGVIPFFIPLASLAPIARTNQRAGVGVPDFEASDLLRRSRSGENQPKVVKDALHGRPIPKYSQSRGYQPEVYWSHSVPSKTFSGIRMRLRCKK